MNNESQSVAIGVDLGGTSVKSGLVTVTGEILYQNKLPARASEGPKAVLSQIEASIKDCLSHADKKEIKGIGIGSPGIVDNEGMVKSPPNLADWDAIPLGREVEKSFEFPVFVENDANAAAIAESKFGAGRNHPDFLFVIWGTGVGGGVILNRKIYRGPSGGAGEIGHISVNFEGPLCNCGSRGCVEAYVGQRYLSHRTAEKLRAGEKSIIVELVSGDFNKIEPLIISQAAERGDLLANHVLTEAATLLGVAIGSAMNLMDLRVSIIGGGVSAAGNGTMNNIKHSVQRHVLKPLRADIQVIRAELGNNAGMLGAAGLVL
ncbi:MAG: ROK family protein [Ignavibacteria bacterium]|nr:ROK family protein [Ignavibacteria bacterium]